jgi:hypothetical protein
MSTKHTTRRQRSKQYRNALENASGANSHRFECDSFEAISGGKCAIDRDAKVVRDVKVIGFTSKNGRRFKEEAIEGAVGLYEGAKVYLDHPDPKEITKTRGVRDRNGVLKNARFVAGAGVFADWHYNSSHAATEALLEEIERNPSTLGFSHNARYRYGKPDGGTDIVEAIVAVRSVDLVADPATTNGMFEGVIADKVAQSEQMKMIHAAAEMLHQCCYSEDGEEPSDMSEKAIEIATDLIAELTPKQTQESADMDLKDYSLEAILAGRPDIAAIKAKADSLEATSKAATDALEASLNDVSEKYKAAKQRLDQLEAVEAARAKSDAIEAEIKASGVDATKITASVRKSLDALESVDRVSFLNDLKDLVAAKPPVQTQKPVTSEPVKDATESVSGIDDFVAAFTGISAK